MGNSNIDERKAFEEEQARLAIEYARMNDKKQSNKKKGVIFGVTSLVCLIIAGIIVFTAVIIPNKYTKAKSLLETGNYAEAQSLFVELKNYKDSKELAEKYRIYNCVEGDIVTFGNYEQDNNTSNGKEPIEWQVLAKDGNKVLVISKYILDYKEYDEDFSITDYETYRSTWETSPLRRWLGSIFLNDAFSKEEQLQIVTTSIKNPASSFGVGGCDNTSDKVFLLSHSEFERYFEYYSSGKTSATTYATMKHQDKHGYFYESNCSWWLRTSGNRTYAYLAFEPDEYKLKLEGINVFAYTGIRPAVWIDISEK